MSIKKIDRYKILPEQGGSVCIQGYVNNQPWKTTTIVEFKDRLVRTKSGSTYELITPEVGVWGINLQIQRPAIYQKLSHLI